MIGTTRSTRRSLHQPAPVFVPRHDTFGLCLHDGRSPGAAEPSTRAHGRLGLALKAIGGCGTPEHGTVIVALNMDGSSFDKVIVDCHPDSVQQIDAAIKALTEARDALKRMGQNR